MRVTRFASCFVVAATAAVGCGGNPDNSLFDGSVPYGDDDGGPAERDALAPPHPEAGGGGSTPDAAPNDAAPNDATTSDDAGKDASGDDAGDGSVGDAHADIDASQD